MQQAISKTKSHILKKTCIQNHKWPDQSLNSCSAFAYAQLCHGVKMYVYSYALLFSYKQRTLNGVMML